MSWLRYLNHDWWQTSEIDSLNRKLRHVQRSRSQVDARLREEIDQLSNDLGRALLLLHSLVETCVRKGVLTRDEIRDVAREIDLADGAADGRVDPAALRPPEEQLPERPPTTLEYLRDLEKQPIDSPGEFLNKLERENGPGRL
ncbi:MAG: hypothetical protein KY475_03400 [Planctomycetes bacterium]|nr:hypothetical protein [Planctomycetota bacterium]